MSFRSFQSQRDTNQKVENEKMRKDFAHVESNSIQFTTRIANELNISSSYSSSPTMDQIRSSSKHVPHPNHHYYALNLQTSSGGEIHCIRFCLSSPTNWRGKYSEFLTEPRNARTTLSSFPFFLPFETTDKSLSLAKFNSLRTLTRCSELDNVFRFLFVPRNDTEEGGERGSQRMEREGDEMHWIIN